MAATGFSQGVGERSNSTIALVPESQAWRGSRCSLTFHLRRSRMVAVCGKVRETHVSGAHLHGIDEDHYQLKTVGDEA
jgi:hypothetical protein